MCITEKQKEVYLLASRYYTPDDKFSAKEFSEKCGQTISAAILTNCVKSGIMEKYITKPVSYSFIDGFQDVIEKMVENQKKGGDNKNLHNAKNKKNDEFYTQLIDIEAEVKHYKKHFKDKVIFCNCDDPEESNFFKYFAMNFEWLGLKKLISTHYDIKEEGTYKLEISREIDINNDGWFDEEDVIKTPLIGNGDFRNAECIEILKEADIVCTNPPFSLFREYVAQLMKYDKKFLIIGNQNAITYKEIFPLIKENKIWTGINSVKEFIRPDGSIKKFGNIRWFTNIPHSKRNKELFLTKTYNKEDYQHYDNYDAIEVSKVVDIPKDYAGVIGVPITFLDKYNPEQFEIVKFRKGDDDKDLSINGKSPYFRILIKYTDQWKNIHKKDFK